MGKYDPTLMKIGTQTNKNMLSFKVTIPEVKIKFQDGRHVGNSSACYKMGDYHPILMKIGTQTKKNMLSLKITYSESAGEISRLPSPPPCWKLKCVL
jgi:hypothetical protein